MFILLGEMTDSSSQNCDSYYDRIGYVGIDGVTSNTHGLPNWQHPTSGSKDIWGKLICLGDIQLLSCTTGSSSVGWKRIKHGSWSSL